MRRAHILFLLSALSIVFIAGCIQTPPVACTPDWQCTNWTACSAGTQTRTCNDTAACNTTEGRPAENQNCTQAIGHYSGNVSDLGLNKEDMLGPVFWGQQKETILNASAGSDIDKQNGLESAYKITYRYDNSSIFPELRAVQGFTFFDFYQVIYAFPIVNGETNSTYLDELRSKDAGGKKQMLYDDIVRFQDRTIITSYDSSNFQELPTFDIADEEFVYRFSLTNNQYLYGIVFKNEKSGILEKIWINGLGTNVDILEQVVTAAWSKV